MGRRARQRIRLRALQRTVWGEGLVHERDRLRIHRRRRFGALAVTGLGGQLLLTAFGIVMLSTPASAHTSTINISCTQVEFVFQNFPDVTATAHETVVINGIPAASRDITFQGPGTTDTIAITLGPGSNTIEAADSWAYRHHERGSTDAVETLASCHPPSTTTTSTVPATSTTSPSSTSTSVPPTSSTTSSTVAVSTTTTPSSTTSTSSVVSSSTTSVPVTSTTIHELGSTTTTVAATTSTVPVLVSTTTIGHGRLAFTGSSGTPFAIAFGAIGVGMLALGLGRLRRTV